MLKLFLIKSVGLQSEQSARSFLSFAMIALFASFLTLCLAGASDELVPEALGLDDQCVAEGCSVSALQLHAKGLVEPGQLPPKDPEEALMEWHSGYYGHAPRADISVANYKLLMKNITVQQKAIMALWNRSVKLGEEVDVVVKQVEKDSGLKVKDWVDTVALVEDMETQEKVEAQGDQPREELVKKWISYMDREMGLVFNKLNSKGKLVAACGTLMSKNPVPLSLQKQNQAKETDTSLAQTEPVMPGDHVGIGDELWRSVVETVTNIHTAQKSANDLESHIQKIRKMIVDFNDGKLIPNEGFEQS